MSIKAKIKQLTFLQKIVIVVVMLVAVFFIFRRFRTASTSAPTYQTETAQTGTLISTVTSSGTVTTSNSINITTSLNGTINHVYVKNGDTVKVGQKIADISPDQDSLQRQTAAYASYLSTVNSQKSSAQNKLSLQSQLESGRKAILDAQTAVDTMNTYLANGWVNPSTKLPYTDLEKQSILSTLTSANQNFKLLEQKYADADASITSSSVQVSSAWLAYQQLSSTLTAPAAGIINNLIIAPGVSINKVTSGSNSSTTLQTIGSITKPQSSLQATVALTEIDVPKVAPNQKVTITLDAFPTKTFTGKVLAIDTNGQTSSSVTTYPATVSIDTDATNIYPNMAVNANIITSVKENVILVSSSAVQTSNGTSTVRKLIDQKLVVVPVETGDSNDTQTAITSGVAVGDTVVTSVTSATTAKTSSSSTSVFSSLGGARTGSFSSGNVRIQSR